MPEIESSRELNAQILLFEVRIFVVSSEVRILVELARSKH
jgi:hypothetical protein